MHRLVPLAGLLCIAAATSPQFLSQWEEFKHKHNKVYHSPEEEVYRKSVFFQNLKTIEEHNARYDGGLSSYKLAVNQFADISREEFVKKSGLLNYEEQPEGRTFSRLTESVATANLPSSFDWRDYGAVSPVKQQGECLSCYAFTALGCLESLYYLKNNIMLDLSEQNIVDCSWSTNDHGCRGGYMDRVYKYIREFGIMNETSYPYTGTDDSCRWDKTKSILKIKSYQWVGKSVEELKESVVNIGPIATALDYKELQFYHSGIFDAKDPFQHLTHGVLVVGYGVEDGADYWIIKNSYGSEWGENGFARINIDATDKVGLTMGAIYPEF